MKKVDKSSSAGTEVDSSTNVDGSQVCQPIAKPNVIGRALRPKVVNHGDVFGTGNWYTFYCGNCGNQITNKQEKCDSNQGCDETIDWS